MIGSSRETQQVNNETPTTEASPRSSASLDSLPALSLHLSSPSSPLLHLDHCTSLASPLSIVLPWRNQSHSHLATDQPAPFILAKYRSRSATRDRVQPGWGQGCSVMYFLNRWRSTSTTPEAVFFRRVQSRTFAQLDATHGDSMLTLIDAMHCLG